MTRHVWIRCFVVSLVTALLVPVVTNTLMVPDAGEVVVDLAAIDTDRLDQMSDEEFARYTRDPPMRRLDGIERFTYYFSHPQFWHFYSLGVAASFLWLFVATTLVSYLHVRRKRDA